MRPLILSLLLAFAATAIGAEKSPLVLNASNQPSVLTSADVIRLPTTGPFYTALVPTATADRDITLPDADIIVAGSASALTSGRIPHATTGGLLTDSALMQFSSGTLTLGDNTSAGGITLNGASGAVKSINVIQRAGVTAWGVFVRDATDDYRIRAYDDAGAAIDYPLTIARAAGGAVTIARPTTINGNLTLSSGSSLAMSGASTLTTGAGAVTLNGDVTVATSRNFTINNAFTFATGIDAWPGAGSDAFGVIARTGGGGGGAPFNQAGSMLYRARLSGDAGRSSHVFYTGASATERLRINELGTVTIGSAALATTATDGFLYIPTCAGTPTGTPTTYTGRAPLVIDSTNNKLYFYSGGAWRDAGP